MNEIEFYENKEFGKVRTVVKDGEPWLVGKDVAEILGYSNTSKAVATHVDAEDKAFIMLDIADARNGNVPIGRSRTAIINESGFYSLVLSSKTPKAKEFKRWVTSEVLPAIRRHGSYMTPESIEKTLSDPDFIIQLAATLKTEQEKNKKLQVSVSQLTVDKQIMQPKADYFDELVDRNLLTGVRETAKELKIKQKVFVDFLLGKKYLYRDKKGKLMPYAKPLENGIFELREFSNEKTGFSGTQVFVTPKGKETFRLLLLD